MLGIITEKKLVDKIVDIEERLQDRIERNLRRELNDVLEEKMLDVHIIFNEKIGKEAFIDSVIDRINRKQLKGKGS